MRACVRVCLRACVHVHLRVCVCARVGMRVRANPAFVKQYTTAENRGDLMRWGIDAHARGTVVGTADGRSELRVLWDSGEVGINVKAGKRDEYWLMTAAS